MENPSELIVTKIFDHPVERVWGAWVTPEQIAKWFAPGIVMDVRELDVRVDGKFRFADPSEPEGGEYTGTYLTVEPQKELSFKVVDYSRDEHVMGEVAGFKIVFEDMGQQSKITLTSVPPAPFHQETFDAWTGCFERLEGVIQ